MLHYAKQCTNKRLQYVTDVTNVANISFQIEQLCNNRVSNKQHTYTII